MELQGPASSYRAPFPLVPTITPAKPYYRLTSFTDKDKETSASGFAECVFLRGDAPPSSGSGGMSRRDEGEWFAPVLATEEVFEATSTLRRHRRLLSENQIMSVMEGEHKFSRWVVPTNSHRRMSDRGLDMRNEDNLILVGDSFPHSSGSNDFPNQPQIPINWMVPPEAERSWNKSPRPIADLVHNYESPPSPRAAKYRTLPKRLSTSSRIPVFKMAERYMQSRTVKE